MTGHTTATIATPSDRRIVITRSFDAPRRVVFEAWTKPEHVSAWWDPTGARLAACEIDLRPNGAFRFVHAGQVGMAHTFAGEYREIDPPRRLTFTTRSASGSESVGTLVFDEYDGTTTLTMTIVCASAADRAAMLKMRIDVGTARTLDNLAAYLNTLRPASEDA